jgi:hypothetical protein
MEGWKGKEEISKEKEKGYPTQTGKLVLPKITSHSALCDCLKGKKKRKK